MDRSEKIYAFDFDGVIADSFGFHLARLQEYTGLAITVEEYREMSMGNFYTSAWYMQHSDKLDGYDRYLANHALKASIYDGMREVVDVCAERGVCYIISSGSESHITDFLQQHAIDQIFGTRVWGAETHWSKVVKLERIREHYVDPAIVFVGDTRGDIAEGRQAHVHTIAVTWGFHDRATLRSAEPDVICDTVEELRAALLGDGCRDA